MLKPYVKPGSEPYLERENSSPFLRIPRLELKLPRGNRARTRNALTRLSYRLCRRPMLRGLKAYVTWRNWYGIALYLMSIRNWNYYIPFTFRGTTWKRKTCSFRLYLGFCLACFQLNGNFPTALIFESHGSEARCLLHKAYRFYEHFVP